MNTRLEAHKCGIGVLTSEALVSIGSGPNSTPPLKMRRGDYEDERKKTRKIRTKLYEKKLSGKKSSLWRTWFQRKMVMKGLNC